MYVYQLCMSFQSTVTNSVTFSARFVVSHQAVRVLGQMCGLWFFLFLNHPLNVIKAFGIKVVTCGLHQHGYKKFPLTWWYFILLLKN